MYRITSINSVVVRVSKQNLQNLGSLVVVSNDNYSSNKGEVILLPEVVTKDFEAYTQILDNLAVGDIVVFMSKSRVELIKEDSEYKYIAVPLDHIVLIEKRVEDS